jgi:hypothetical protein
MIMMRRMRRAGHVVGRRGSIQGSDGKAIGKRPLGRHTHKWDNIKIDLREIG